MKYIILLAFAMTVPLANWLIANVGTCIPNGPCVIPVGFGLSAPSGVLMIGVALVLRDILQERAGMKFVWAGVCAGVALTAVTAPAPLVVASAVAFAVSEGADTLVYSKLRARGTALAVAASGIAGAAVDSLLFLQVAFGSVDFAAGLILAKLYASAAFALVLFTMARKPWAAE